MCKVYKVIRVQGKKYEGSYDYGKTVPQLCATLGEYCGSSSKIELWSFRLWWQKRKTDFGPDHTKDHMVTMDTYAQQTYATIA